MLAVGEQSLEGDGTGNGSVVEEERDGAARRKFAGIRSRGIDLRTFDVLPTRRTDATFLSCLMRSEDGVLDAKLGEDFEGFDICGSFGKPHAFRLALEAILEIAH